MDEFEKQIEEQMKIYQMQLQDQLNRLRNLMRNLGIDNESKLNAVLDFAELFNKLRRDGVIEKLSDRY